MCARRPSPRHGCRLPWPAPAGGPSPSHPAGTARPGTTWELGAWGASAVSWVLRRREAAGVEVLADAVERLARIAEAREAGELGVHGVTRADFDHAVAQAGVE